jgi:hypothetical protein
MNDLPPSRRLLLRAALGLCATLPLAARAQEAAWEFVELRPREFSLTRRPPPPTMAIEFGGQRVSSGARWDRLSDAERLAVRQIQPGPLSEGDEPPYPRLGLTPMIDRLHVVRGPVGQPLRVLLEIDAYGAPQRIGIEGGVNDTFRRQMLTLMSDAAFKPGTCDGKACTRVFAMDLVYLGRPG